MHHDVLGDAVAVAVGDLGDRDAAIHRGLQIGVVGADAGGDDHLELRRLGDALGRHVGRPERLRDDDLGVVQLLVELGVRCRPCRRSRPACGRPSRGICAGRARPRRCRAAAPGLKSIADGRRRRLAVGILGDLRNVVARIGLRVAVDRVVVKHTNDLRHR